MVCAVPCCGLRRITLLALVAVASRGSRLLRVLRAARRWAFRRLYQARGRAPGARPKANTGHVQAAKAGMAGGRAQNHEIPKNRENLNAKTSRQVHSAQRRTLKTT